MSQPVNGTADPSATPEAIAKVLEHVHQLKKKEEEKSRKETNCSTRPHKDKQRLIITSHRKKMKVTLEKS